MMFVRHLLLWQSKQRRGKANKLLLLLLISMCVETELCLRQVRE